jgi:putative SOS response-associated peptidase YedK
MQLWPFFTSQNFSTNKFSMCGRFALPDETFNARSEDTAKKPTWLKSLHSQRCLMPVRG